MIKLAIVFTFFMLCSHSLYAVGTEGSFAQAMWNASHNLKENPDLLKKFCKKINVDPEVKKAAVNTLKAQLILVSFASEKDQPLIWGHDSLIENIEACE